MPATESAASRLRFVLHPLRTWQTPGWMLLLAGLFLMVSGDGLTNRHMPVPAHAWPWLYLVLMGASFAWLAAAGCVRLRGAAWVDPLRRPVALLLTAFLVSALFSQVPSLSAFALAAVAGIVAAGWIASRLLEQDARHEAVWIALVAAAMFLSYRVISWRLAEGLHVEASQILSTAWLGKLQLAWVFNLLGPFFLARAISAARPGAALFAGMAWLASGAATYVLFSRMGSLVFLLMAIAVCLLNRAYWRRWAGLLLAALFAGGVLFLGSTDMTRRMVATFADAVRNPGIPARLSAWRDSIQMFQARPLTGVGLGTFDEVAYALPGTTADPHFHRQGWHAHNVYLHLLAETGLPGLIAWCYLWYVVLAVLARAWYRAPPRARAYPAAALCSVAAFLTLSITEVLIGARVHASLRMNLLLVLLVVFGLRLAAAASGAQAASAPADAARQARSA